MRQRQKRQERESAFGNEQSYISSFLVFSFSRRLPFSSIKHVFLARFLRFSPIFIFVRRFSLKKRTRTREWNSHRVKRLIHFYKYARTNFQKEKINFHPSLSLYFPILHWISNGIKVWVNWILIKQYRIHRELAISLQFRSC